MLYLGRSGHFERSARLAGRHRGFCDSQSPLTGRYFKCCISVNHFQLKFQKIAGLMLKMNSRQNICSNLNHEDPQLKCFLE